MVWVALLHEKFDGVVVNHQIKGNVGLYCWSDTEQGTEFVSCSLCHDIENFILLDVTTLNFGNELSCRVSLVDFSEASLVQAPPTIPQAGLEIKEVHIEAETSDVNLVVDDFPTVKNADDLRVPEVFSVGNGPLVVQSNPMQPETLLCDSLAEKVTFDSRHEPFVAD